MRVDRVERVAVLVFANSSRDKFRCDFLVNVSSMGKCESKLLVKLARTMSPNASTSSSS